jgi:hypothetical protein
MSEVYIWPDGTFHLEDDGAIPHCMGDDYMVLEVPEDEEDIELWVEIQCAEVHLGLSCEQRTRV